MRGKIVVLLLFLFAGLGALGITLAVRFGGEPLPVISNVPDFSLSDQDGKPFDLNRLKETAVVVDFFFTRCMGPCPMMAAEMAKLQAFFSDDPRIRFVSISVDSKNDSASVLREYAESVGAKPERWLFLTGDPLAVTALSEEGFKLAASSWPVGHSIKFVLCDRQGRIRGYYDSSDAKEMETLRKNIVKLLRSEG